MHRVLAGIQNRNHQTASELARQIGLACGDRGVVLEGKSYHPRLFKDKNPNSVEIKIQDGASAHYG